MSQEAAATRRRRASVGPRPARPLLLLAALLLAAVSILLYVLSSFATLSARLDVNQQCRMSSMWPAYIDHTASLEPFSPSALWRKYRLYLYRERTVEPHDIPSGSPALFVPGNAGSYAQIRSVASSAAHQCYQPGTPGMRQPEWQNLGLHGANTDWWTVHFNQDFSAFSGSTLIQQATFLNEVLAYLRDRYPSPASSSVATGERNVTVPILAHSMGGISARLMTTLDNHPPDSVDTVVTLSTPHAFPPAPFDKSIESVYRAINRPAARGGARKKGKVEQPLLISLAGGLLDSQLPSDPASLSMAALHAQAPSASRLSTFTSSLPSLWSSVDHLAIMWCDQVREKIARGFLLDAATFGRLADERNLGGLHGDASVPRKRREMWRRVLGVAQQQDGGSFGLSATLESESHQSQSDDGEVHVDTNDSPVLKMEIEGIDSILDVAKAADTIYHRPASLADDGAAAFEMITNLCIGANPSAGTGSPTPQPVELIVLMCRRGADPGNPTKIGKAVCELVLPWRWQLMPPSGLPDAQGRDAVTVGSDESAAGTAAGYPNAFPDAHRLYHVPGQAFQRLRIDAKTVREKAIEFIRVERKADDGVVQKEHGRRSFTRAGWVRELDGRFTRHGGLGPGVVNLKTAPLQPPSCQTDAEAALVTEWSVSGMGSALLAYDIDLHPSKCFLDNVARSVADSSKPPTGSFYTQSAALAPLLRVSDPLTGDSRWFPSLVPPALVNSLKHASGTMQGKAYAIRLPLALHGAAPFLPPPKVNNVHVQLWTDPAMLQQQALGNEKCAAAFDSIRISVNWRTSVGLMVMRYRFVVVSWPLALLACVVARMWHDWIAASSTDHHEGGVDGFPSVLDYLTCRWTVKVLLPSLLAALVSGDLVQRFLYAALGVGRDETMSWTVGAIVGMPQPAGIVTLLLIAACLVVSLQVLLSIALVLHRGIGFGAKLARKVGLARRMSWGPLPPSSGGRPKFRSASLAGLAGLVLAVVLVVPHQFVFLVLCLMHIGNTLRSRIDLDASTSTATGSAGASHDVRWIRSRRKSSNDLRSVGVEGYTIVVPFAPSISSVRGRYNQHLALLVPLLLLLPQKATVLVVWARNLASVGLVSPRTSAKWIDHNPFDVLPLLLLVWILAGGRTVERPRKAAWWIEKRMGVWMWIVMGATGWLGGLRWTWMLYEAMLGVAWAVVGVHAIARRTGQGQTAYTPVVSSQDDDDLNSSTDEAIAMQTRTDTPSVAPWSSSIPLHHLSLPALQSPPRSSSKLDDLLQQYLTTLDQYQHLRQASANHLVEAYFQLGKAKMTLGHTRVGRDAYDARLKAEIRVRVQNDEIRVQRVVPRYGEDEEEEKGEAEKGERVRIKEGLRHRTTSRPSPSKLNDVTSSSTAPSSSDIDGDIDIDDDKKDTPSNIVPLSKKKSPPNALYQFAALPPSSLRRSQREFGKALDMSLGIEAEGLVQVSSRLRELEQSIRQIRSRTDVQ